MAVFGSNGAYVGGVPTGVDTYDEKHVAGAVWSLDAGGSLVKINPTTRSVELPVSIGNDQGWTVGGGAVWVDSADKPVVKRIDAQYGSVTQIKLPKKGLGGGDPTASAVAYGDGSLWVAQNGGSSIARLNPTTGALQHRIAVSGISILRFGDGALYAIDQNQGDFQKIDPTSSTIAWTAHIHPWIADALPAAGVLWLTVDSDAGVYRFSEGDGSQAGFTHTGDGSGGLAYGDGSVWVSNGRAGTISRVDSVNLHVRTFPMENAPTGLAVTPSGSVFVGIVRRPPDVAATLHGAVAHFVMREDWLDPVDPGSGYSERDWELEYATEAKLYNYPDWPGTNPAEPVPEIAAGPPTVTHKGGVWSYAISIRPGYRTSCTLNARRSPRRRCATPSSGRYRPTTTVARPRVRGTSACAPDAHGTSSGQARSCPERPRTWRGYRHMDPPCSSKRLGRCRNFRRCWPCRSTARCRSVRRSQTSIPQPTRSPPQAPTTSPTKTSDGKRCCDKTRTTAARGPTPSTRSSTTSASTPAPPPLASFKERSTTSPKVTPTSAC